MSMQTCLSLLAVLVTGCGVGCDDRNAPAQSRPALASPSAPSATQAMTIIIGSTTFTATLDDNPTTAALKKLLPLTLDMSDLNANEKVYHLDTRLPTDTITPGTIRAGDLLLWQDRSVVLFYKTFQSPYSYTRLGKLNDPTGLAEAVGSGSVTVTFTRE